MAATDRAWLVEVAPAREGGGEGKPSRSAVWRNAWARDGFPKLKAGISTCWDVLCVAAEQFGDRPALGVRRQSSRSTTAAVGSSPYEFISYTQLLANVKQLAAAMSSKCGLGRGSHVAIFGGNSPEWLTVLLACHALGAAAVPVYDTLGEAAVEFILGHGDASAMFCSAAKFPAAAAALARAQHGVATLVVLDAADDVQGQQQIAATSLPPGVQLDSWQDFTAGLSSQAAAVSLEGPASAEDVCVIMYTSGTTGDPKGVLLTYRAVLASMAGLDEFVARQGLSVQRGAERYLSFLPLAHCFDLVAEHLALSWGAAIGYWRGDPKGLAEDAQALAPTIFAAVPRVFDRLHTTVKAQVGRGTRLRRAVFAWAYNRKLSAMRAGWPEWEASPLADGLVLRKVARALGGRLKLVISGGAPLSGAVEEFIKVCLCCPAGQGYGLTESCAASFMQPLGLMQQLAGTVGPPLPSTEFCLQSVPEMGYEALVVTTVPRQQTAAEDQEKAAGGGDGGSRAPAPAGAEECAAAVSSSSSAGSSTGGGQQLPSPQQQPPWPAGEVLLRGPTMFSGYHKAPEKTAEVVDEEGWFHTGDIAKLTPEGYLRIIDCKKNIFKLSQGEYIAVEKLEGLYAGAPSVDQIFVTGSSEKHSLVAVVVPDLGHIRSALASGALQQQQQRGGASSATDEELAASPAVRQYVLAQLEQVGRASRLRGFVMVKAVHLHPEAFSVEAGLMTPTLKLKRPQLQRRFAQEIADMYRQLGD